MPLAQVLPLPLSECACPAPQAVKQPPRLSLPESCRGTSVPASGMDLLRPCLTVPQLTCCSGSVPCCCLQHGTGRLELAERRTAPRSPQVRCLLRSARSWGAGRGAAWLPGSKAAAQSMPLEGRLFQTITSCAGHTRLAAQLAQALRNKGKGQAVTISSVICPGPLQPVCPSITALQPPFVVLPLCDFPGSLEPEHFSSESRVHCWHFSLLNYLSHCTDGKAFTVRVG